MSDESTVDSQSDIIVDVEEREKWDETVTD
jgi:hypothetical protein